MGQTFFQITSPRDMLAKAKREFEKLKLDVNTDNIFNFFVSAYHVVDYVKKLNLAPQNEIEKFEKDSDFQDCRFICNKGKHLVLNKMPDKDTNTTHIGGAMWNTFQWNTRQWNDPGRSVFTVDGKEIDPVALGEKLIQKWEKFLSDNGI